MNNSFSKKIKKINSIKGKHKDCEFVVFGGGPSIEKINNLRFLNNKVVISCNYKKNNIKADYHLLHDPLSIMWWEKNNVDANNSNLIFSDICVQYLEYNDSNINKNEKIIALNKTHVRDRWLGDVPLQEYLNQLTYLSRKSNKNFYYLNSPFYKFKEKFGIGVENNAVADKWYGSGFLAIETAIYLGAKKVYLVGFDGGQSHSYENNPSDRHYRMKNKTLYHWQPHTSHLKSLSKKVEIILVNPEYSIYNGYTTGVLKL